MHPCARAACVLLVAACFAARADAPAPTFDVERALRGVVLLVATGHDDEVAFGAGVVFDEKGLVLTNLHVVAEARSIAALAYDPAALVSAAIDGGLSRVLFERERDLRRAVLVRGDP